MEQLVGGEGSISEVVIIVAISDGLSNCIFHTDWNDVNIWRKTNNAIEKEKITGVMSLSWGISYEVNQY